MKKGIIAVVAILLLVLPMTAKAGLLKVGDDYVPFTLDSDEGKPVDISKEVGKGMVVLNFMNTVCSTCVAEMDFFRKFFEQNPKSDVKFFPIAVDMKGAATVKPFKEAQGFTWTFLLDPTFITGRKYRAGSTPHTVVIGKDGKIKALMTGYDEAGRDELKKILK